MVPEKPVPFEEYIPMLLVVFLTEKSYICVQKYDDSELIYFGEQIIVKTPTQPQLNST